MFHLIIYGFAARSDSDQTETNSGDEADIVDSDVDDQLTGPGIEPQIGDWVAVRLEVEGKRDRAAFLYLGRVTNADSENSASSEKSVSIEFLKRKSDGSYVWPDRDDTSVTSAKQVYKVGEPIQEVLQSKRTEIVEVKFLFNAVHIENARKQLKVPIANVR